MTTPIIFITIPVQWEDEDTKPTRVRVDEIEMYAPVIWGDGNDYTMIRSRGRRYRVDMTLGEFEKLYLQAVDRYNQLIQKQVDNIGAL
jgi:recombinational DNA repair ATPase RecF